MIDCEVVSVSYTQNENKYLTVRQAAEIMGMSIRSLQQLCADRKIRHTRTTGGTLRIRTDWIDEFYQLNIVEPVGR